MMPLCVISIYSRTVGETVVGLEGEPLFFSNVEWGFAKKHKGAWKALPE